METATDFILRGSKITAGGDCSHEIKRHLLPGRKVMINLDSIFKSRDITLPTKVHLVKAMVFPVVMFGKRCRDPRCSPRGNPACRGTFGGRRKAVRDRFALQGGKGTSLETPSRARASSCQEVGTTWFFSSCGGILELRRGWPHPRGSSRISS